jgi:hypothetical protein
MAPPTFWIALLFAALGGVYLIFGLRAPASTSVGPNPARKARLRISLIFLAVSLFLFFRYGAIW